MNLDDLTNDITIGGYITNPNGKRSGNILNVSAIASNLNDRYNKLNKEKMKMLIYSDDKSIYIRTFIPSEAYDIRYDVIFQLPKNNEGNIKNCTFKVYSNSPAFAYNYAYLFNCQDLLISTLKNKYGKDILQKPPIQRNSYNIINLDKSLYFAIIFILENYTTTNELLVDAKSYNKKVFDDVKDIDEKIFEYNRVKLKDKKDKERKEKETKSTKERITNTISNITSGKIKNKITGKSKITGKKKITGKRKR